MNTIVITMYKRGRISMHIHVPWQVLERPFSGAVYSEMQIMVRNQAEDSYDTSLKHFSPPKPAYVLYESKSILTTVNVTFIL